MELIFLICLLARVMVRNTIEDIFRSREAPSNAKDFCLCVYQCFSQVQDAFIEIDRFTMGYVDSYLNDGREMIRSAKQKRKELREQYRQLNISIK